jgi:hypothetical protein
MAASIAFCCLLFLASAAAFTADLNIKECDRSGCRAAKKRIALDSTSNHTSSGGASLIAVGGAGLDELTLTYGGSDVGGPRVYLIEGEGVNENYMFTLKGKELTFEVELSTMPCGFNAALYFVGMTANEGHAESGTNYCDAQAVKGTFCSEMDVLEANTVAQQVTTHACVPACGSYSSAAGCQGRQGVPSEICDQSGCGLNPFRYGPGTTYDDERNNLHWYGPGGGNALDSTKPFTVVTQFHGAVGGGGGGGGLANITRYYIQDGRRVDLPTLYVVKPNGGQTMLGYAKPAITASYCDNIYDRWNPSLSPLGQMARNMDSGMVLAMSAWYDRETYSNGKPVGGTQTGMSWLDGVNQWSVKPASQQAPACWLAACLLLARLDRARCTSPDCSLTCACVVRGAWCVVRGACTAGGISPRRGRAMSRRQTQEARTVRPSQTYASETSCANHPTPAQRSGRDGLFVEMIE